MLADRKFFSEKDAGRWISSLKGSTEEADILCHSLLRLLPFSKSLRAKLSQSDKPIYRYLGLRLLFTEIANDPENAKSIAEREFEKNEPLTRAIAHQIIDEANFLKEA